MQISKLQISRILSHEFALPRLMNIDKIFRFSLLEHSWCVTPMTDNFYELLKVPFDKIGRFPYPVLDKNLIEEICRSAWLDSNFKEGHFPHLCKFL